MMSEFTGSVLELNDKHAIVMTESCDFVSIHRQPEMFVGQQVKFRKSDLIRTNKSYMRYFALAASVFIIALCSVFYFQIFIPNAVFAYVDVDINPSIEFVINKNAKVLDIKFLNNDGETLLKELKLVDLPLKEAISELVKASKQLGFISTNNRNAVLISASVNEEKNYTENGSKQKALDDILSDIGSFTFDVGTENIKPEIIKVTPENRKSALKNDISMGRYDLYSKIKLGNNDITVEKARTERVSDMLDKAKIKGYNKNESDGSKNSKVTDSKNDESKHSNSKNTDSTFTDSNDSDSKGSNSKNVNSKSNNSKKNNDDSKINKNREKDNSNPSNNEGLLTKKDKNDNNTSNNEKDKTDSNTSNNEKDKTDSNTSNNEKDKTYNNNSKNEKDKTYNNNLKNEKDEKDIKSKQNSDEDYNSQVINDNNNNDNKSNDKPTRNSK